MCKKQDFLYNLRKIAFAHQCEFYQNFAQFLLKTQENLCTIITRFLCTKF